MSEPQIPKEMIKGIECKYVCYQESRDGSKDDMILVKEVVHTKDNRQIPRIKLIENFKRPVYTTKKPYRNHTDKKEYKELDKLDPRDTKQSRMSETLQRALGRSVPNPKLQLREICRDQNIYFADLAPTTMIKAAYRKKNPDLITRNKVAVLDIEADVVFGTDEPIMISVTMGKKKIIGISDWWAKRIPDIENTLHAKYEEYLSSITLKEKCKKTRKNIHVEHNLIEERGGDFKIIKNGNMAEVIRDVMREVHEWMPDFVAIWNMNYDLPKIMACCEKYNIPHEDVWCDPKVPDKYRRVWYKQAKSQRETNSKTIAQHPADLWHVLYTLAGFYVIDAMCAFKKIRVANGNEPDYKLDGVLNRHLGIGKLKFDQVKAPEGDIKWHIEMQRDYPAEYCIYNLFDCVSIELLDEKTNDLGLTVPALAGISEYHIFPSLPKRLVDNLHYFYLDRKLIAGCVGADITSDLDDDVINMTGWIVTLPAHMVEDNGLQCVKEIPKLKTMFRVQTADDDITQAYPTAELTLNISKETTFVELKGIEGVSEMARRRSGINLTGGQTNAIEICNELLNMPYIHTVLDAFESDIKEGLI